MEVDDDSDAVFAFMILHQAGIIIQTQKDKYSFNDEKMHLHASPPFDSSFDNSWVSVVPRLDLVHVPINCTLEGIPVRIVSDEQKSVIVPKELQRCDAISCDQMFCSRHGSFPVRSGG